MVDLMSYLGSKKASGAYQAVIASMSKHDVFIDAFYGSGSIILNKPKTIRNIAIDLNDK